MRAERWWQDSSVVDQIFKKAGSFEFIQSIRLLRHLPAPSRQQDWSDDFKFGTSFSLSFPATEIEELSYQDQRIHLTNLVVGLTGTQGALPYTYTNKLKQSSRQQRLEIKAFLGLFNHKLTTKYVDASIAYNLPVRYEIEQKNHYLDILHALNGYIRSQHQQHDLDEYFAEFSGLMQGQNNTAHALKTILGRVFDTQVQIQEFVKEKFQLGDEQKTTLGGSHPSLLGINTFCGDTVEQIDGKIEIQIGPLNREQYLAFLPNQPLNKKLKDLIQTWCSPTLFIDVRLILDKNEIRPISLDSSHAMGLGQGAFLMPSEQLQHNSETRYALLGAA
ncbi:type VI secretion system baseplate subunit TssG [Acinetobacter courvalinii]|uniref:Type VI secretion protein n=1 Tax=Acinetobacter courvalinii TaxID=280147 RepID=N9PYV7_9GAMM|nr:type VI secretion system baseplate subunit TssG [Acinetobacter courvalinii]ENX38693.1 type VI secretion protein [Acinetobacter courvalinii]KAB0657657.1 type VI secretion system baseplate subunit TssG [Acinetobacter courvalinii]RSN82990.1 type VI secretion system baseplate subunit TssG [Acinetobacter baumannii]GGH34722.1 type VI secretion protein [Acinetobacter courvalinii]